MAATIISLIQFKFDNSYLKIIYSLYCLWLFLLVLRVLPFLGDYSYLKKFLFNSWYGGMLYFAPLLLLFPRDLFFYKKVFDVILIFGIFFILYDIVFIRFLLYSPLSDQDFGVIESFSDLSFSSGFILLTYAYHSKKKQLLAITVVLLALLFAIIRARRGLILMYGNMIFFSYLFYIFSSKFRLIIIYSTVLIALIGAIYISGIYKPGNSPIFGYLLERGTEDTRTGVELSFYDDMKTKDWIIGRGIKGEYFCPNIEENQITNYRSNIETGYLQTILKGGLMSFGLFLLIAIPAIFMGLFNSKNILSKAAAVWILLSLTKLYPTIENTFTLHYLLVWVSIGICYSKEIRKLPEAEMKDYFHSIPASFIK
jgi:hypothetical protein